MNSVIIGNGDLNEYEGTGWITRLSICRIDSTPRKRRWWNFRFSLLENNPRTHNQASPSLKHQAWPNPRDAIHSNQSGSISTMKHLHAEKDKQALQKTAMWSVNQNV